MSRRAPTVVPSSPTVGKTVRVLVGYCSESVRSPRGRGAVVWGTGDDRAGETSVPPNTAVGVARTVPVYTAVQSAATGDPAYSQSMPCTASSARLARQLVTSALHTWALSPLADTAVLVASELVTNAVAHTQCRNIRVTITRIGVFKVRVAVVDKSRTRPTPRVEATSGESGRGLAVVEAVSDRWGADLLPWGKRVWADLSADETGPVLDVLVAP